MSKSILINRIHNEALDLKTGLITWKEFDKELEKIVQNIKDGYYSLD